MMITRGGSARVANNATRLFSTTGRSAAVAAEPVVVAATKGLGIGGEVFGAPNKWGHWVRTPAVHGGSIVRNGSTLALSEKENDKHEVNSYSNGDAAGGNKEEKRVVSYWGIQPSKVTKPDGTEWKWNCFRVCLCL